jgi:UDP-glucose 4-epimerase
MRILITGGGGYIGARLCNHLADNGHQVIPLCYPHKPMDATWNAKMEQVLVGDLRDASTIKLVQNVLPEAIIHLVSLDHYESEGSPGEVASINIHPTWVLLDEMATSTLQKFIYFSTIHVYGNSISGIITEANPIAPSNIYGLTHYLSEEICNYYGRKTEIECVNVRLSNSYGEPLLSNPKSWDIIVNSLCLSAFTLGKIVLKGDGSPIRDFVHYDYLCDCIEQLLKAERKNNKDVVQLSSGSSFSMMEIAIKVQKVYQQKYGKIIDIYINSTEKASTYIEMDKKSLLIQKSDLFDSKSESIVTLENGITRIFSYLEEVEVPLA